jgi:hypothetical protein
MKNNSIISTKPRTSPATGFNIKDIINGYIARKTTTQIAEYILCSLRKRILMEEIKGTERIRWVAGRGLLNLLSRFAIISVIIREEKVIYSTILSQVRILKKIKIPRMKRRITATIVNM